NVPDFLLWIETDRLIPPWDVQQDVFEAYLEDAEEEEPTGEDDEEEEEDEFDEEEIAEEEEFVEMVDEEPEDVDSAISDPQSAIPEEPVTPFADPPTGPFDRADLDAWDW